MVWFLRAKSKCFILSRLLEVACISLATFQIPLKKMAQSNLISHKEVLSYDKQDEKQIYNSLKNFRG